MPQDLQFVAMERSHLPEALRLSIAAGWPHRLEDWEAVQAVSQGVAAVEDGTVVATGYCTTYGNRSRLNMIIVDERLRGRGIGKRLVAELVALARQRPTALVATEDGFPLYRKFGFEPNGKIGQFQGTVTEVPKSGRSVRRAAADEFSAVLAMDRAASDSDREALLSNLAHDGQMHVADGGYAILRDFGRGKVIGPVVAAELDVAQALVVAAAQGLEGAFLRIDTDPELGLVPMVESLGLRPVGGGTTMFAGAVPNPKQFTTFALASQALG